MSCGSGLLPSATVKPLAIRRSMNSRRLSAASGWMSSKSAVPSTSNPSRPGATTTGSAATIAIRIPSTVSRPESRRQPGLSRAGRSGRQDVVDDDRPLFGDRDEMVVVASQESSAYGTVAEPDPPTRSPQMEPLPRYDDP